MLQTLENAPAIRSGLRACLLRGQVLECAEQVLALLFQECRKRIDLRRHASYYSATGLEIALLGWNTHIPFHIRPPTT